MGKRRIIIVGKRRIIIDGEKKDYNRWGKEGT